jgi:hypothetical protein
MARTSYSCGWLSEANHILKTGKRAMRSKITAKTSKPKLKAGQRVVNRKKRRVERPANVSTLPRREGDMFAKMPADGSLLREQYAFCTQDEPPVVRLPPYAWRGGKIFIVEVPDGYSYTLARAGRLLFSRVREVVDANSTLVSYGEDIRVHPPEVEGYRGTQRSWRVDKVLGRWWRNVREFIRVRW